MTVGTSERLRGPKGHFLTGVIPEVRRDVLAFLEDCANNYGDAVPVRFGPKPALVLNRAENVEQLLVEHHRDFVKSVAYRVMQRALGHGIFTSEGELWRRQRQLAQPAFHHERIVAYADVMVAYAQRMLAGWQDGAERRIDEDMLQLTLEIVAKCLFDADVAGDAAEVATAQGEVRLRLMDVINSLEFMLPAAVPTPTNLRLKRAVRRLDDIVYRIIRERRASGRPASDLLATLLAARAEDGTAMSDEQLRDEVMTLFLAGHETTAVTLTWTWYLLSASPAAELRLHEELDTALAGRLPHVGDLARLRYAEAVVYEALRLYPPVVVLGREAIRNCEIGGHAIPRGTTVIVSPWLLHRDPRYFEDPQAFRPERWLDGLAERLPRFAYCPFGAGPRRCIGASFAIMELVLVLATIARCFRLGLEAGHAVVPRVDLTLRPRDGMVMSIHARDGRGAANRR